MSVRCVRNRGVEILIISIISVVSVVAQWLFGDFPTDLFSAPLNIICVIFVVVASVEMYRHREQWALSQYMLSMRATWLSLLLLVLVSVALGIQRDPASSAWGVVVTMLFVVVHLTLVTLRGWRGVKGVRWRFMVNHLGLWLVLVAGLFGAPDRREVRMAVEYDYPTIEAYNMGGRASVVEYELQLSDFNIEHYEDGTPSCYHATVLVDGKEVVLQVNNPYNLTWCDTLYLVSYDTEEPCGYVVLELVREPWRWVTTVGIVLLIIGALMMFVRGPRVAHDRVDI